MTAPTRLASARPRWSHRDPVEGGNPFTPGDPRHRPWAEATATAQAALRRHDAAWAAVEVDTGVTSRYRTRLVDLAAARFDTWATRGLVVVDGPAALADYDAWLHRYVDNWIAYVADTCPGVAVDDALRTRLGARVGHWQAAARAGLR